MKNGNEAMTKILREKTETQIKYIVRKNTKEKGTERERY